MAGLFQNFSIFTPGYLGKGLAIFFTRHIGLIGAMLLAAAFLLLSATLYGLIRPASIIGRISGAAGFIRSLVPSRAKEQNRRYIDPRFPDDDMEDILSQPSRFVLTKPKPYGSRYDSRDEAMDREISEERDHPLYSPEIPAQRPEVPPLQDEPLHEEPAEREESQPDYLDEILKTDGIGRPQEDMGTSPEMSDETEDLFILRGPDEFTDEGLPVHDAGFDSEQGESDDPHALPDIEFNEMEAKKRLMPGTFPPPLDLFGPRQELGAAEDHEVVREQAVSIIATLSDFGVGAEMADIVVGPTVIQFQLQLAPGIKVSKVSGLSNDLAVALTVPTLRVEAPIPGKPYVGVEIPNPKRKGIVLRTILESRAFQESENDLPLAMGMRVDSRTLVVGLEDLPHLLVAGTTGSGKSVFINSCITGLCTHRNPEELRLILIDPKRVELNIYEHLPHVLSKPVVSSKKAVQALAWAVREMENRYELFARSRVRNLKSYNQKVLPKAKLPNIVIVVDELADLMFTAQKDVEDYICRLAQMARATGIHLILATQRPSVNVITGLIKANIPARVAFTLPSQTDSRTIIDVAGAERLLGKGDMLFVSSRYPRPLRLQAPYIEDGKSIEIVEYLENIFGSPEYVDIEAQGPGESTAGGEAVFADDPLLEEAVNIIMDTGIASASRLQRQLRIGFTRAARMVDSMERIGIVGPPDGSKPREILVDEETAKEMLSRVLSGDFE
ncbi:MAG: DNA translocase FtsK [Synergistaceae bacterium]|nr:DNA translocase FtsK [Synergistaceae bacterium]